jgi:hypothetical protein
VPCLDGRPKPALKLAMTVSEVAESTSSGRIP